jgi:hypothetical protein
VYGSQSGTDWVTSTLITPRNGLAVTTPSRSKRLPGMEEADGQARQTGWQKPGHGGMPMPPVTQTLGTRNPDVFTPGG